MQTKVCFLYLAQGFTSWRFYRDITGCDAALKQHGENLHGRNFHSKTASEFHKIQGNKNNTLN